MSYHWELNESAITKEPKENPIEDPITEKPKEKNITNDPKKDPIADNLKSMKT